MLAFLFADLVQVIDFVGVKAKRGDARYVARSYPVASLEQAVEQLRLGRPVLASALITQDWLEPEAFRTGLLDFERRGVVQGSTVCVIVGLDPREKTIRLLTPWPEFGGNGIATLTERAANAALGGIEMRSIEAVERPERSK
jgi:hypothetical protein